jgi:hypothetical protein
MEAIETVNVVTNSFDAEQGLAGGSAVNVQIKSGTNSFHGSAFEYHTDNALRARGFFLPTNQGKPKLVYNQFGGTIGGPIKKDKLFFFGDYEGTFERRLADRRLSVPTMAMRAGDLSASPTPLFDPFTGTAANNDNDKRPMSKDLSGRINPISAKILSFLPAPNIPKADPNDFVNNYYATGRYLFDRKSADTKINWNATSKLNIYGRFSAAHWDMNAPVAFGQMGQDLAGGNPGKGFGNTYSYTIAGNYLLTPHMIVDAHFGWTRMDSSVEQPGLDQNIGRDVLGIPGTNGTRRFEGGWPRFEVTGFATLGVTLAFMPYYRSDPQYQYVANLGWTKGSHNIRLGMDLYRQNMNHTQAEHYTETQPASGGFLFNRDITAIKGSKVSEYNSFAAFLLGVPTNRGRILLVPDVYHTRTWSHSYYARDQWQVTQKLTLTYGLRYEYFPYPTRDTRGVERYDFATNKMLVCGLGSVPQDCGVSVSKTMFAPRFGFAYRVTDSLVVRGGYGITNDPFNIARSLRVNVPVLVPFIQRGDNVSPIRDGGSVQTMQNGIPAIPVPDFSTGIASIQGDFGLTTTAKDFVRGYIQSWNLTLQKEFLHNLVGSVGYVATRQVKAMGLLEQNYGFPGGGKSSQVLWNPVGPDGQPFRRDADTRLVGPVGNSHYDSLQATLERRFANGLQLNASYTWGKGIGIYNVEDSTDGPAIKIPAYYNLNRAVFGYDRTHSFNLAGIYEFPLGKGKKWINTGIGNALVGGWQANWLLSSYSGLPFGVSADGKGLNAPKNSQRADLVKPAQKLGGIGDSPYYDPTAFAEVTTARFGTVGFNSLRGPGLMNLDFGLFRDFRVTEKLHMQFRAEALNLTNTPHFGNPRSDRSGSKFMIVDSIVNSGREPAGDERVFRFGLRLAF